MQFMNTTLENGLQIVGEHNPNAQSMACGYFVKAGARDETPEVGGVSHFLEHMMFKGGERRSPEDINREFDEIGAQYNAFTSVQNTVYFGRVLPECQPRLIDLLSDMMRPSLRNEDFDMEKNVILEEIAMYEDNPRAVAYYIGRELFANGHPAGNDVLGSAESISALQRDQMAAYFERMYSSGNMLAALTGNFDWEAAVAQIEEATREWKAFDVHREHAELQCKKQVKVVQNEQFTQEHLVWFWPGFSVQDERRIAADILVHALGDSVGSRLYWELVDPGIASTALMGHMPEDRFGLFNAYASCDPERAGEVAQKLEAVINDAAGGLSADELERAKQKIASAAVLQSESPMGRLIPVGMEWAYLRRHTSVDEAVNKILETGQSGIDAILDPNPFERGTLLALGPLETLDIQDK